MYLVQLLLPLYANDGQPFEAELYAGLRTELVQRFGGLTLYVRAPAHGLWQQGSAPGNAAPQAAVNADELLIYEVMADTLDEQWWSACRRDLERRFRQQSLVVRAHEIRLL